MKNIIFKNDMFVNYYSKYRRTWEEFYDSERHIFEAVLGRFDEPFSVLDVGCGCGGLGNALSDKFSLSFYKGLDINEQQIEWALRNNKLPVPHEFACEDLATYAKEEKYDVVISLGCVDCNVAVNEMIENAWQKVREGGYFITSIRLTNAESINDIKRAFQYMNFGDKYEEDDEIGNYVVFSLPDILRVFGELKNPPDKVEAYGYWHKPSKTAIIEYDELCMSVFALHKAIDGTAKRDRVNVELDLPFDFYAKMK